MRFSILIPVYNVEKYLEECLDSVLSQSFTDYEIVLVDDGSTDSSGAICDRYAHEHADTIRVVHKENGGLISARRVGIAEARGEYCVFVDSDDFVEPDLLETVDKRIADSGADIVVYSFRYFRNGVKAEHSPSITEDGFVWQGKSKHSLYRLLIETPLIDSLWTKAIRTDILLNDKIDYTSYYGLNMSEDTLQSLYPITLAEKIVYIDKPLYNYRINTQSVSRSYRYSTIPNKNTNHVYDEIKKILPLWQMDDEETHEKHRNRWFSEAIYTFVQYYENAERNERKMIVDFDWDSMIPEMPNEITNAAYAKLYELIKSKSYQKIKYYFAKKKIYAKLKKIKRSIMKKQK